MHKYILFFTLLILLASCSASGGSSPGTTTGRSYADQLRDRANGQLGQQTPTAPLAQPTTPAPPPQRQQVIAMPTPQTQQAQQTQPNVSSSVGAIEQMGSDYETDAAISIAAFTTSPLAMFAFAAAVAGFVIRKKERK